MGPSWSASNSGTPCRPALTAVVYGWTARLLTPLHRSTSHPQHLDQGDP
jgi:hypothetical protein